jgi:hypothetical protein
MAVIEFKNIETETAFKAACQPTQEMIKLKRIAYLHKNGLVHPDIVQLKNIDMRAYW